MRALSARGYPKSERLLQGDARLHHLRAHERPLRQQHAIPGQIERAMKRRKRALARNTLPRTAFGGCFRQARIC